MISSNFYRIIFFFGLFLNSCNFSPGSYPYAEKYEFNFKESELIAAVNQFKLNNPKYIVPKDIGLVDGRSDSNDKWYHVYFYYPKENEIIYTWIRSNSEKNTTFAFISINKGTSIGKWKEINKDFDSHENELNKTEFKKRILNKIKSLLEK